MQGHGAGASIARTAPAPLPVTGIQEPKAPMCEAGKNAAHRLISRVIKINADNHVGHLAGHPSPVRGGRQVDIPSLISGFLKNDRDAVLPRGLAPFKFGCIKAAVWRIRGPRSEARQASSISPAIQVRQINRSPFAVFCPTGTLLSVSRAAPPLSLFAR